ncbi:type II secretion system F family protein [Polaromonas aquatica]|uniref:Type II secretion system F family protein n=1 Tax=Polaromonas aquatica TaxID=332657 RepID=A0ABW1TUD9_9BURK
MTLDELNSAYVRWQFRSAGKVRQALWRKLSKQLRDGIPLIAGLSEIRALKKPNAAISVAIAEWVRGLNNGRKLSDVVQPWVTTEESMLIVAGEQSGSLDDALQSVVKVAKASAAIRSAVIGGLAYPIFLLFVSIAALYFFGFKIIPAFSKAARPDVWVGLARTMIDAAAFIQNWLLWICVVVVILVGAFFVSLPRWNSSVRVVLDRYAPYSIYRVMQGSSWLIALSALVQAGVRIETAIEQLGMNAHAWARARSDAALKGLRAGRNLGESLERSGYEFPDREIISDIRLYASKSGFDEALRQIGDEWITESVDRVKSLMNIVFGVSMLLVGGVIMFIAAGFVAMQLQLTQILQRATQ